MKKRVLYKTVTYFTKTKRSHEMFIAYTHNYKIGCSFHSAQGARRFTAIATPHEIETWQREIANNKPPMRVIDGKQIPNRHQRKHGFV